MSVKLNRCNGHRSGGTFFCCETLTGGSITVDCFGDRLATVGGDLSIKVTGPAGSQRATIGAREARAMAYSILAQQGMDS